MSSWWLWLILSVLFYTPTIVSVIARRQLSKEIDQNEKFPTPD